MVERGSKYAQGQDRSRSVSPTKPDDTPDDTRPSSSENNDKAQPLDLTRIESIADTLSLPREIIFVAIVCSAQLLTRTSCKDQFPSLSKSLMAMHFMLNVYRPKV